MARCPPTRSAPTLLRRCSKPARRGSSRGAIGSRSRQPRSGWGLQSPLDFPLTLTPISFDAVDALVDTIVTTSFGSSSASAQSRASARTRRQRWMRDCRSGSSGCGITMVRCRWPRRLVLRTASSGCRRGRLLDTRRILPTTARSRIERSVGSAQHAEHLVRADGFIVQCQWTAVVFSVLSVANGSTSSGRRCPGE